MSIMKDFDWIRNNLKNNVYSAPKRPENKHRKPENFIFDENKTIKENRELVKKWNEDIDTSIRNYYTECSQRVIQLREDLKEVILSEYNFNGYQAEKIIDKAYEHYDTYNDLIDKVEEIADFIVEVTDGKY